MRWTTTDLLGATVFAVSFVIPYIIPFILRLSSWYGVWIVVGVVSLIAFPLMMESDNKEGKSVC